MKPTIRVTGAARFAKKLETYAAAVEREVASVLKQEARALCVELGSATMPGPGFDEGKSTKFAERVEKDVKRVFASRSSPASIYQMLVNYAPAYANAYWHAYKSGREGAMAAILRKANLPKGLDANLHKSVRSGKKGRVKPLASALSLVSEPQLRAYINKQKSLVGFAKAGWYAAAKSLGGRVRSNSVGSDGSRKTEEIFPSSVRKLANRFPGIGGSRVQLGKKASIAIYSAVRHASSALSQPMYSSAVSRARDKFQASLARSMRTLREKTFRNAA